MFNTHVNFDEIVCNNKAAISTMGWLQPEVKHLPSALGCCSKSSCGSTYLGALEVAWEQVQDVPRAFAHVSVRQFEVRGL